MDLELTDEQIWLSESIDTLLERAGAAPEQVTGATPEQRRGTWRALVEFGALSTDQLGAVELCLIARSLGARLASVPFVGSAAARLALGGVGDEAVALALLDGTARSKTTLERRGDSACVLRGEKVAVEQLDLAQRIVVLARCGAEPALALVAVDADGLSAEPRRSFDETLPTAAVRFDGVAGSPMTGAAARDAIERLTTVGALLAAAEAIGAARAVLELACRYAAERRQFGRRIASFQALRHVLADAYVRESSGWSTVLYAAAAFDDGASDARLTASVAKAYVSRGARAIAHDAMQVFAGIAFTAEHPAHRFLRRIVVRERQFGDAAHHERALGRALAARATGATAPPAEARVS